MGAAVRAQRIHFISISSTRSSMPNSFLLMKLAKMQIALDALCYLRQVAERDSLTRQVLHVPPDHGEEKATINLLFGKRTRRHGRWDEIIRR